MHDRRRSAISFLGRRGVVLTLGAILACACGAAARSPEARPSGPDAAAQAPPSQRVTERVTSGSLRQQEVSVTVGAGGLGVRMMPLDESVIGVLAPDSYLRMRDLIASRAAEIDNLARSKGRDGFAVWYFQFFAVEPDVRFNPWEVVISSGGRDYRPEEIIPLTNGFGQQVINQRETQAGLFLFDRELTASQPLEIAVLGVRNSDWGGILRVIERERQKIRTGAVDTVSRFRESSGVEKQPPQLMESRAPW